MTLRGVVMRGYSDERDELVQRLRRIEGQIRGLQRMVESDEYCIDILTQVAAASKALQSVAIRLLDQPAPLRHRGCRSRSRGQPAKVDEATRAIERLLRS